MNIKIKCILLMESNAFLLALLTLILVITRLTLISDAPFVYNLDPYTYLTQARVFASSGTIQIGVGTPFIIALGVFLFIFGSSFGTIIASRLLMLLMTALAVIVIYLFGLKMSGKVFGFLAALFAIFVPIFLSYSIVPHNDVFAMAMGLAGLYLATSDSKLAYILSPIPVYIAIFVRPELSIVFVLPILIYSILKTLGNYSFKPFSRFVYYLCIYVVPILWVYNYANTFTRYGTLEKFTLFVTPNLISKTLFYTFSFYNSSVLNQVFMFFIIFGVILSISIFIFNLFKIQKQGRTRLILYSKTSMLKNLILSDQAILVLMIGLVFALDVIAITAYGYGYTIVDNKLEISSLTTERYLILPSLLLSYAFVYPLSVVVRKLWAVAIHGR